jgi:hypothetical protein
MAWGKERLYFYRLSFAPIYIPHEIQEKLLVIFDGHRVGSYVVYELYGSWDLLIRVWLPSDVSSEEFEQTLKDSLRSVHLNQLTDFAGTLLRATWGQHRRALWPRRGCLQGIKPAPLVL